MGSRDSNLAPSSTASGTAPSSTAHRTAIWHPAVRQQGYGTHSTALGCNMAPSSMANSMAPSRTAHRTAMAPSSTGNKVWHPAVRPQGQQYGTQQYGQQYNPYGTGQFTRSQYRHLCYCKPGTRGFLFLGKMFPPVQHLLGTLY